MENCFLEIQKLLLASAEAKALAKKLNIQHAKAEALTHPCNKLFEKDEEQLSSMSNRT